MSRPVAIIAAALLLAGCAETQQERVRELTDDAVHLYRRGAYADARDTFQLALAQRPDDGDLIYNLARCHDKLGNAAEADKLYQRCLERAPDHLQARHALLVRQVEAGRHAEAVQAVQTWLRASPNLAGPYIEDGWLRARDGDLDNARARLQQAIDREPRHPRALAELAAIYEKLGRPERAVVLYQRSLDADADQPAIAQRLQELRARGVSAPHPD